MSEAPGPQAPSAEADTRLLIPWDELGDGGLRRLKRGVHFRGPPEAIEHAARLTAAEVGKTAVTTPERIGRRQYLWVQFLDGKVEAGDPCPRCANARLETAHQFFARCPSCRAVLELAEGPSSPLSTVAELLYLRLLSPGGGPAERMNVLHEASIEAGYRLLEPVAGVDVRLVFYVNETKIFTAVCPDLVSVPDPQTVRFHLRISPKVLVPGDYLVAARLRIEGDPYAFGVLMHEALYFRAFDPTLSEPPVLVAKARTQRPGLQWSVFPPEVADAPEPQRLTSPS